MVFFNAEKEEIIINEETYHLPKSYDNEDVYNPDNNHIVLVDSHNRYGIVDMEGNILVPFIYIELKPITEQSDYYIATLDDGHQTITNGGYTYYKTIVASDGLDLFGDQKNRYDEIVDYKDGRISLAHGDDWQGAIYGGYNGKNLIISTESLPLYHQKALIDKRISELNAARTEIVSQIEEKNSLKSSSKK